MSLNTFPLDISQYQILDIIGCGATSSVYKAKYLGNGKIISIKKIDLEINEIEIDVLRREVAFWSTSNNPGIVDYYGSFINGSILYILMEYCAGGSVLDIMKSSFPEGFKDEVQIATILKGILEALAYVHSNKQVHRDIKPGNVLICEDGSIKIGDFGVAASLLEQGKKRARYTVIGTPCYMAPEVFGEIGYTEKADIWSLGISSIELATGVAPYSNLPPLRITKQIINAPPPKLPSEGFTPEFQEFVRKCLNHSTESRPSAEELLKHPFIAKAQSKQYIIDTILSKVPPLEQRAANNKLLQMENTPKKVPPLSPTQPKWNYGVEEKNQQPVEKMGRFRIRRGSHETTPPQNNELQHQSQSNEPSQLQNQCSDKNNGNDELRKRVEDLEKKVDVLAKENEQFKKQIRALLTTIQQLSKK
ncbi:STE family protein kinase [Histomonas meleagridis]|uniref:STE family protein kinase n=1 Tax=Histomonas meleagridis TaxID=135588 RepID=UPI00355A837D|nr:STE family protein kinase [Histomonas meleagridis]KAH0804060.1 STE family protein kinase [Histomonas meleagridis]